MPKKKPKVEEPVETKETSAEIAGATEAVETAEAQAPVETAETVGVQDVPAGAGESIPPESAEDFGLPEQDDPIPEPDMENAVDFLSDDVEILSAAPVPLAEGALEAGEASGAAEVEAAGGPPMDAGGEIGERFLSGAAAPPIMAERAPSRPGLMAEGAERRAFFDLDFHELDRNLSRPERQEWNSIYASFRGHSVMSGKIAGINPHGFRIRDRRTGEVTTRVFYCAVVIPFRVPILIPETELWFRGEERPRNVMRNIGGATIDFLITQVDRETNFVVASRRLALASRRYYFSTQPQLNQPGARSECSVLTVGDRRMLATCHGYDVSLTQRDLDYTAIPNLKDRYRRGDVLECIVKEYNSRQNHLVISVKEAVPNPYDGAEFRHPRGCSRQALISGKYGGGVFCNLTDGVTVMCNYSFQYEDNDFRIGDSVTVVIQRYDSAKKQIFGKIVAKE